MIRETPLPMIWLMRQEVMYSQESIAFVQLEDDPLGQHWGLYENDELLSVISVFDQGKEVQFRKFATREKMQHKGYGSQLLQFVFDRAVAAGKESVWCNARTSAMALYEKFGMQRFGECWEKRGIGYVKMKKIF